MTDEPHQLTALLHAASNGDSEARDELLRSVYEELRVMARERIQRERSDCTIHPTDLVHETYLRVMGGATPSFDHRRHFFSAAAQAMRRVLIDRHRRRVAAKRGGDWQRTPLDTVAAPSETETIDIQLLSEALDAFSDLDSRAHSVVEFRYFLGMSDEEIGDLLGIAARTVRADWLSAKGWLWRRMSELRGDESGI